MEEVEDSAVGAALLSRTAALSAAESLGPPDLCYVCKTAQRHRGALRGLLGGSTSDDDTSRSAAFYHHVIGLDVSSPAPIASYVADLAAPQQVGWLASTETWSVTGAVYCSWDCFARMDLRVHISIPGGVRALCVLPDGNGEVHADEPTWRRVAMSGLLRALCPLPALLPMGQPVRSMALALAPEDEPAFLDEARALLLAAIGGTAVSPTDGANPHALGTHPPAA